MDIHIPGTRFVNVCIIDPVTGDDMAEYFAEKIQPGAGVYFDAKEDEWRARTLGDAMRFSRLAADYESVLHKVDSLAAELGKDVVYPLISSLPAKDPNYAIGAKSRLSVLELNAPSLLSVTELICTVKRNRSNPLKMEGIRLLKQPCKVVFVDGPNMLVARPNSRFSWEKVDLLDAKSSHSFVTGTNGSVSDFELAAAHHAKRQFDAQANWIIREI